MRTTLSMIIWAGALVLFFSSCNLLGEKKDKPAIPGKIVFSMTDDDTKKGQDYQIYVMNADGSGLKQLTNFESDIAFEPSWSPDGEQIVFSTSLNNNSTGFSLYIMNADGSDIHPMKERPNTNVPVGGWYARWSPDGTKIAYEIYAALVGFTEIFIYDFETDSVEKITDHRWGNGSYPTWSPDGQQLAFTSDRDYHDADTLRYRRDLYSVNIDGTDLQRLTETGNATRPQWHPDNSLIAYEWNRGGNKAYLIDLDSKEIVEVETDLEFAGSPQWSIGGTYLILSGRQNEGSPREIQLFHFENNQLSFMGKINDNPIRKFGTSDWYYNENN